MTQIPTKIISDRFSDRHLILTTDRHSGVSAMIEFLTNKGDKELVEKLKKDTVDPSGVSGRLSSFTSEMTESIGMLWLNTSKIAEDVTNGISKTNAIKEKLFSDIEYKQSNVEETIFLETISVLTHEIVHWIQVLATTHSHRKTIDDLFNKKSQTTIVQTLHGPITNWSERIYHWLFNHYYESVPNSEHKSWLDNPTTVFYEVSKVHNSNYVMTNKVGSLQQLDSNKLEFGSLGPIRKPVINIHSRDLGIIHLSQLEENKSPIESLAKYTSALLYNTLIRYVSDMGLSINIKWVALGTRELCAYTVQALMKVHYRYMENIFLESNILKRKYL